MRIRTSETSTPLKHVYELATHYEKITEQSLQAMIETIAIPRHYVAEHRNNTQIGTWIQQQFQQIGYESHVLGDYRNIIAFHSVSRQAPCLIVGAHYDSVPGSPGADDNGSGIAVMLACARALMSVRPPTSTLFLAFNREEDLMKGSQDFVLNDLRPLPISVDEVHILEMVGYCSHQPGSQRVPSGLPVRLPDRGNFLGIVGNQRSASLVRSTLQCAKTYHEGFPVLGLHTYFGVERLFPDLQRSDHAPFWRANIPAVMWTDTAEFRNPFYHSADDTPDTLDYHFMKHVAQLLFCKIWGHECTE
jgi:Zn-dependent M28 family amino/carboxypeptidase